MSEHSELHFGPFCLQSRHGPLLREGQPVRLQPKALSLLWTLAQQAGEVLTKAALLDAVWPGSPVGDTALSFQVQALRRALGDDQHAEPVYIATTHRVGLRFIAPVRRGVARPPAATVAPPLFGRQAELHTLRALLTQAAAGQPQRVFITGEAGLGKTALVQAFVAEAEAEGHLLLRGQCAEQGGESEPYRPLLTALSRLLRDAPDDSLLDRMQRLAPSWLVQMPGLLPTAEYAALQRATAGVRKERMLRELGEVLEQLAARQTLLLVLEDLHWCDTATLDFLAWLAQQPGPGRCLLVLTLRPVEAIVAAHPARTLQLALQGRGQARELPLAPLDYAAVQQWLAYRLPEPPGPTLCQRVYARSEGHPLFLTQLSQHLAEHGVAAVADALLPDGLRELILMQLRQLEPAALQLLEAAAVAGPVFAAAGVAAALGLTPEAAEQTLERLAERQHFVADQGLAIWPDGTVGGQFGFRHSLYGEVLYAGLPASRRARLHRLLAERLEAAYGARATEVAGDLARHFAQGGVREKALRYRIHTARHALRCLAFAAVRQDVADGLALLDALPAGPAHDHAELALRVVAACAQQAEFGYATTHSHEHFDRIPLLLERATDPTVLEPALWAMWLQRYFQARFEDAVWYAGQVRALGKRLGQPVLEAAGCAWGGISLHVMGRVLESDRQSARAARLLAAREGPRELIECSVLLSRSLTRWLLGYPDQALQQAEASCALAVALDNPVTHCLVRLGALGSVLTYRRDWARLSEEAARSIELCDRYGHRDGLNWAERQRVLALCFGNDPEQGLALLPPLIETSRRQGQPLGVTMDCTHAAEVWLRLGRTAEARALLDEAWAALRQLGARVWEPEVIRTEGELLRVREGEQSAAAESCFLRAAQLARTRQVRSHQLRAECSLARVYRARGRADKALALLQPLVAGFREGRDSADLREALALVAALKAEAPAKKKALRGSWGQSYRP